MEMSIRPWRMDDLDSLVKYANNKNVADNLVDAFPHPYTDNDGKFFLEMMAGQQPTKAFAIEYNGEAIGGIGVFPDSDVYRKNAAIGYWLAETFWGKGIMLQAIKLIIAYAFKTFDVTRIYAKPYAHNTASHRVLEKAGFVLEATLKNSVYKNGAYADEMIFVLKDEYKPGK